MYVFNDLDVSVWMFRTFLTQCLQVVDDYIFSVAAVTTYISEPPEFTFHVHVLDSNICELNIIL